MARREDVDIIIIVNGHNAGGDEAGTDLRFLILIIIQGQRIVVGRSLVAALDGHGDSAGRLLVSISGAFPFLADFDLLGFRGNGGRVLEALHLRTVISSGVGVFQCGICVGIKGIVIAACALVQVFLDIIIQAVIILRVIFQLGDKVQRILAGSAVEGDGIGHAVQQGAYVYKTPVHLAVGKGRIVLRSGSVIIKSVGGLPLILENTCREGTLNCDRIAFAPGNFNVAAALIRQGISNIFTGNGIHPGNGIISPGERHPVFVGRGVDLKQLGDFAGGSCNRSGSAVADLHLGDAQGLYDSGKNLLDSRSQGRGISGVVIIGRCNCCAGNISFPAVQCIVNEVVQKVFFVTESIDTVKSGVRRLRTSRPIISDLERFIDSGKIVLVNGIRGRIGHTLLRRAVCNEHNKGRVAVCAAQNGHRLPQRSFPVSAGSIGQLSGGAVAGKPVQVSTFGVSPALRCSRAAVKGDQSHLHTAIIEQAVRKIIDDLLGPLGAGIGGVAGAVIDILLPATPVIINCTSKCFSIC